MRLSATSERDIDERLSRIERGEFGESDVREVRDHVLFLRSQLRNEEIGTMEYAMHRVADAIEETNRLHEVAARHRMEEFEANRQERSRYAEAVDDMRRVMAAHVAQRAELMQLRSEEVRVSEATQSAVEEAQIEATSRERSARYALVGSLGVTLLNILWAAVQWWASGGAE